MIPLISLPAKLLRLLEGNVSPQEVAAGICLAMFLGFIPLNGPMVVILILFFLFFKLNRISVILMLPLFKLLYILGISSITDWIGSFLLIDMKFLSPFWQIVTHLPVLAYLDINNTLVIGGLAISSILTFPLFIVSRKLVVSMQSKYGEKLAKIKLIKWVKALPFVVKISKLIRD